jgi:hypothetical protein
MPVRPSKQTPHQCDCFRRRATTAPRRGGSPIAAVANIADLLAGLRFAQDQQAVWRCRWCRHEGAPSGGRHVVALGRHAEAGIVVGGLAALAMRRGMAVTVDATVPDPWRSEASVAVAAEGWMTGQRPSRSLVPKHRLALPVACTPTTSRCAHDRRESRMQPSTSTATAQPLTSKSSTWASRPEPSPDGTSAPSLLFLGGKGRPRQAVASSEVTCPWRHQEENPPPADHFLCAWAGCPAPPVGLGACGARPCDGMAPRGATRPPLPGPGGSGDR